MKSLIQQIKDRRKALNLKQADMHMRAGFSRQQYQRLEASGNPRLDTLELLAKGLEAELLLIPNEKLAKVLEVLKSEPIERRFKEIEPINFKKIMTAKGFGASDSPTSKDKKPSSSDPWDEMFEEEDQ